MALCFAVAKSLHSRSGIEQTDYLEEESVSNIDDRGEGRGCKRERERERLRATLVREAGNGRARPHSTSGGSRDIAPNVNDSPQASPGTFTGQS